MQAGKNKLRTEAANLVTSIDVGLTIITKSATTLNPSPSCCIFGSTSALVEPVTIGIFGPGLRSSVTGKLQSWRFLS